MNKQFLAFLAIGLAVVGIGLYALVYSTKGSHVDLKGEILKVRVLALNDKASLVMLDFRATNPSDLRFVIKTVQIIIDPPQGDPVEGAIISKADVDNVFKYQKLLGPKYNDVVSIKDTIKAHQTADRMAGARFELPEAEIDKRKAIRLRIEELDGVIVEIVKRMATDEHR